MKTVRPRQICAHILLDDALAFIVERAGRLVEDQNARVRDKGAGDRDALPLAARQAGRRARRRWCRSPCGSSRMNSCAPASLAAAMTRSIGIAGSASAMLSRTERLNSTFSCSTTPIWRRSQDGSTMAEVDAIDQDAPALRHVEPLDQLGQRALAGARRADDADDLSGRHL